uniref:Arachidonate 12-lipoxygenase, 12R type n=1 Tax=Aquila chrysaetos chrysaetos TaxID=223781 RepID=A0A663EZT6_AQUCH
MEDKDPEEDGGKGSWWWWGWWEGVLVVVGWWEGVLVVGLWRKGVLGIVGRVLGRWRKKILRRMVGRGSWWWWGWWEGVWVVVGMVGRGLGQLPTAKAVAPPSQEKDLTVRCEQDLGPIVLIRLHKWRLFLEDAWFCKDVRVTAPDGTLYRFPCYQWLEGVITVEFREGKKLADDELEILREHRRRELKERQEAYQWKTFAEGWPRCLNVDSVLELDSNVRFSCVRATNFNATPLVPEYVAAHWREDDFFGYQFLNGNNPIVIRQCAALPAKFPVTPQMVADFLGGGTDLDKEMREGRIFIVDYDVLDDIPAGTIHGRQQYIAAPLCLLHQGADGLLRPIAIQLSQTPGPTSPVFLPSDAEWDWLLAKTWVRNADFYSHQLLTHLLRTHLFGEVFAVATLRQLPSCHPIFKLLIPHFHFTLHINTLARSVLINPGGIIDKVSSGGTGGLLLLVRRGLEKVTYASLCLPDDIRQRGMTQIPNYRYRDDGMILWETIRRWVTTGRGGPMGDAWAMEIFVNGFLSRTSSGIPSSLRTVAELGKFLTMVVFTCSVQHAAVNNGQVGPRSHLLVPNAPSSMRHPPPTAKGKTFLQHFLDTLPELMGPRPCVPSQRLLGQYLEERFTEAEPRRIIRTFRGELEEIRDLLEERNHVATLRYNYLNPLETENSISI